MRFTLILAGFVCGLCSCSNHQPDRGAAPQHLDTDVRGLRHEITFHPARENAAPCFIAILSNQSHRELSLRLEDKKFHATLKFRTSQGREFEACEKDYLRLLTCASWIDPVVNLPAGNRIRWVLPLESVVTLDGKPVSAASIHNATLVSELPVSGTILKSKRIRITRPDPFSLQTRQSS